jgi:enoyl-[acyl-carrier protein] reductase I
MIDMVTKVSPLRRNTTPEEVADVALFFLSDLSRAITAEVTHVDEGFHAIGAVKPNDG